MRLPRQALCLGRVDVTRLEPDLPIEISRGDLVVIRNLKSPETYFQAANADSRYRVKLFRLAFDAAVSSFSGRQQLYERYYSGDPVRLAGALYNLYPKDAPIARIHGLLDELEGKS